MFSLNRLALKNKLVLQKSLSKRCVRSVLATVVTGSSLINQSWLSLPAVGQTQPYCKFSPNAIAEKENLRQRSLIGTTEAQQQYKAFVQEHGVLLDRCRKENWPQTQAMWVRLYPCDARPGELDKLLDDLVNKGYNQINVEVFYDSRVLLPKTDNPTPWDSVVRSPGHERVDLLAETIKKGHERGLKVYAWLFTMNFGYNYSQRLDRQDVMARNGRGQNSLDVVHDRYQAFIDPYNRQAQVDYYGLVQKVAERRPDGILFDYIRYPRGTGTQSVVSTVKDLWIYSSASRNALYQRAHNNKGRALIERFVNRGYISTSDLEAVDKLYPSEGEPLWQGRNPTPIAAKQSVRELRKQLQSDLWNLSVAHAAQGIIDFLSLASIPAVEKNIPVGAVFFPGGNKFVGQTGYDSRLQPWDSFPDYMEWHAMSYGVCGDPSCIVKQVSRVVDTASKPTNVTPAIAGVWGAAHGNNRPSLEDQMGAIRQANPQINSVSHFAYSWQEPALDKKRKFCNL